MDTIAYDSTVHHQRLEEASQGHASRASNRSIFLQRVLLGTDLIAAALGGAIPALILGVSIEPALIMTAAVIVSWTLIAFVCGLYNASDLHTWASGLSDAPRTVVAALLVAWPLFALAETVTPDHALPYALGATFSTVMLGSILRALGRGFVHRIAPLRQRTVIVGSGIVADRLADRLDRHDEFGLEAIGLVDDDVHTLDGTQRDCRSWVPRPARRRARRVRGRPRPDRLLAGQPPAAAELHPHLPRPPRRRRRGPAPVRAARRRPGAEPDRRPAAALDRGAAAEPRLARSPSACSTSSPRCSLLIVLSPLLILIAIAIKIDSRGPVFFRQVRAGRGETVQADQVPLHVPERRRAQGGSLEKENEATDGVMFKIKRDPRITRVGRLPAAHLARRAAAAAQRPARRNEPGRPAAADPQRGRARPTRPGTPGDSTCGPGSPGSGRSPAAPTCPSRRWSASTTSTSRGWSLARDIEILLATIPVVISGRGAY